MPITALPPAPSRSDPANFSERGDALMAALPRFIEEANSLEQSLQRVATTGGSATELTVGLGLKSLVVDPGKAWFVGAWVYLVATPDIQNYMVGQVEAYDADTGAMSIQATGFDGAGTFSSWLIGLATPQADGHLAPRNSPAFTGNPTVPTQATGDRSAKVANTEFVANTALGVAQTWQDVKVSRSFGTTYTNTTGKPIEVAVVGLATNASNSLSLVVGGFKTDHSVSPGSGIVTAVKSIVPPGAAYVLAASNLNVETWVELR